MRKSLAKKFWVKLRIYASRLYRIIKNLISSTIRYTPKGGRVKIESYIDPKTGAKILVVQDSRTGMKKDDLFWVDWLVN